MCRMAEVRLLRESRRAVKISLLAVLVVVGLALVATYLAAYWFCAASRAFRLFALRSQSRSANHDIRTYF
jgi:hypothetical protein